MKLWRLFAEKSCPRLTFRVDAPAYLLGALAVLLLPLNWIGAAMIAAMWHECCHWLALKLCGCSCYSIAIGSGGAVMETDIISPWKEALCAFAGPLGSLLLLFFFCWIPRISLCALVQGLYNLIPVYPLDGGRLIRCLLRLVVKNGNYVSITARIETVTIALLTVASIYCLIVLGLGYLALISVGFLMYRIFQRKLSCKEVQLAVQ